ncbi:hypothetical protein NC652_025717 [Populus alba x Populus x berolinensis]|nr:hypothetical protein NC652_025717 [Populus alba x Populus x berolinensis]
MLLFDLLQRYTCVADRILAYDRFLMLTTSKSQNKDMALASSPKKEIQRIGIKKSKNMLYSGTSLASVESLTVPLVQVVVLSADIRCAECQRRVADIMSRMNETESVSINVLEKKVTLTCRYPVVRVSTRQVAAVYGNPLGKMAVIKRIFRSYCP